MPQIINETNPLSSLGQSLGTGIGGGLSELLSSHVANKARKYEENSLAKKLAPHVGGMEKAEIIVALGRNNPKAQQMIVSNIFQEEQKKAQVAKDEALRNFLGQEPTQENQMVTAQKPLDQLSPNQTQVPQAGENNLQQQGLQKQEQISPVMKENLEPKVISPQNELKKYKEAFKRGLITHDQLRDYEKALDKKQAAIDKETFPLYDEINKESKAAKDNIKRLSDLEVLVKKGDLADPIVAAAFDTLAHGLWGVGINLKSLLSADSQEFEKISTDFVKNAKQYFGARLTDTDLRTFLQTVPTLSMSDEAKRRVIENMRYFANAASLKGKIMNDIIQKNGGERPKNLFELVDTRANRELDKMAQEIKDSLAESQKDINTFQGAKEFLDEKNIPKDEQAKFLGMPYRGTQETFKNKRLETPEERRAAEKAEKIRKHEQKKEFARARRSEYRSPLESFSKKG
jgi:hypothetical protein